jgi:ATP-dependent DNA helicase RecG
MPYNPDIANAFFRIGYIEAWGRGFSKMTNICLSAGLPSPLYYYDMSGYWVVFRKDIYNAEYLQSLGLNDRQVKAVLFAKDKGKITNKEYQQMNKTAERTASRDLSDLVGKGIFKNSGVKGAGAFYTLS